MEKLTFKRTQDFYNIEDKTSEAILYLGGFLRFDVAGDTKSWKEWINNPTSQDVGSNYSHLEKHNDKIFIAFDYDWFHETPGAPIFELTIDQLNYILDRWQEALEKKPNKIIITKDDNGEIKVEFND